MERSRLEDPPRLVDMAVAAQLVRAASSYTAVSAWVVLETVEGEAITAVEAGMAIVDLAEVASVEVDRAS